MCYDSTDVCLARALLKASVYIGNGWLPDTKSFCLVDATLLVRRLHEESHADVSMM